MKKGYLITAAVGVGVIALGVLGYFQREKLKETVEDLKQSLKSFHDLDEEE